MEPAIRDVYGAELVRLGKEYPELVVLDADVSSSTKSCLFQSEFPDRFFNVGISEANMTSMAAGLAKAGMVPFVNTFAAFITTIGLLPARSLVAYMNCKVRLAGAYGGLSDSYDGATHHSTDDIAIMRAVPNMTILVASDAVQVKEIMRQSMEIDGPVYFRLSREAMPPLSRQEPVKIGKGCVLREGIDVTIFSCGVMCSQALQAAERLSAEGIEARVVDLFTIKPIDAEIVEASVKQTGAVVTAEEHSVIGGLGAAVLDVMAERDCYAPLVKVGIQDCFTESGAYPALLKKYQVDAGSVIKAAREAVKRKGKPIV
ncbi:transketolase family protein [Massilimaliae timonensis]|uniref:Transketolase family protein n=1 Tax=Massiliimalia timonensis TaxID=1987501 RepID=A0A8J6TWI2_9FIRM|nr:transketolase C-terminal domain-containing protein [Massiliimalia timonensis]MBC8609775.1 transketolase family protein [Massiliimalia timonensis]